ncbi:MAG: N-acetylmuramoyl-L-alanine amidase [Rhodospirillaceae bacterium]|nr:MAG: N-acetylmuramoyl-L-alanine amidase [Rhodospirillaceae bacterium]
MILRDQASPNHDSRPDGQGVDMLVLHYTGMADAGSALARLTDPTTKVSAHYVIDEDGTILRMVAEERRAWHAGRSFWRGATDINARSIGIELVNPGHAFGYRPFAEPQMASLVALAWDILDRHGITARNVVGHADVAPERRQDPGEFFDWARLAAAGVGLWPFRDRGRASGPANEPMATIQTWLALFGYALTINGHRDTATIAALEAFQRHFRPALVQSTPDHDTVRRLETLVRGVCPGPV